MIHGGNCFNETNELEVQKNIHIMIYLYIHIIIDIC